MRLGNALMAIHNALARSLHMDLPNITYETRDWNSWHKLSKTQQADAIRTRTEAKRVESRRPHEDDVEVIMFPQTWGSTALGYGGMGGASVTSAYTVIVHDHVNYCVYFGEGELAYKVTYNMLTSEGKTALREDIHAHRMADRHSAGVRYAMQQVQP